MGAYGETAKEQVSKKRDQLRCCVTRERCRTQEKEVKHDFKVLGLSSTRMLPRTEMELTTCRAGLGAGERSRVWFWIS